ncbi:MAG: glycosyltransferase family 4 protein [Thermoanaerobaculia bacterium]
MDRRGGRTGSTLGRARTGPLFELPAHRTLLRRQRGVIVHSEWAARTLRAEDPQLAVRVAPMALPLPDAVPEGAGRAWRAQRGLPQEALLLGCFGFQTPIKRTDRVIESLSRPELAEAHLVIAGEVAAEMRLEERAAEAGVAERVHSLGYLPWEEFAHAIVACDLCVNLRYPTAGETSASLLRILALGRPVLVSDYAQFTDLPEEVAVRVPLGEREVEELAARVGALGRDPERLAAMSVAARRWIAERHAPERAARAVVEACAGLVTLDPPGQEEAAGPPPPTSLTWSELPGSLDVTGAEGAWGAGEGRRLQVRLENRGLARWLAAGRGAGGLMLDVHWRAGEGGDPVARSWFEVPGDVPPGQSCELDVPVRRPVEGVSVLVVEPHARGVAGFNALGGPVWSREIPE